MLWRCVHHYPSCVAWAADSYQQIVNFVLLGGSWVFASQLFNPNSKSFFNLVLGSEEGDQDEQGWLLDIDVAFPNGENFLDSKNEKYYGAIVANTKAKAATSMQVVFFVTITTVVGSLFFFADQSVLRISGPVFSAITF